MENKKDIWDIFSSISTFLSAVVIALISLYINNAFQQKEFNAQQAQNQKDDESKKLQMLVDLVPYLSSTDSLQNKVSVLVISEMGFDSLAFTLGTHLNTSGATAALKQLSSDSVNMSPKRHKYYANRWQVLKAEKEKEKTEPLTTIAPPKPKPIPDYKSTEKGTPKHQVR